MNDTSSRSHAIMLVTLSEADGKKGPTLFMVDLAGSERVSRSGVSGKAFEEATNINQSLSALGAYWPVTCLRVCVFVRVCVCVCV